MYLIYKIQTQLWWAGWTHVSYTADGAWQPPIKATPITHTCKARRAQPHNITLVTEVIPTTTTMATMSTGSTQAEEQSRPQVEPMGPLQQRRLPPALTRGMTPVA